MGSKKIFIRIEEIPLRLDESELVLGEKIAAILGLEEKNILNFSIVKKAIDSRDKKDILIVYSMDVEIEEPEKYISQKPGLNMKKMKRHRVRLQEPYVYGIKKFLFQKKMTVQ